MRIGEGLAVKKFNFLGNEFIHSNGVAISKYKPLLFEMVGDVAILKYEGGECRKVGDLFHSTSDASMMLMNKLIKLCRD